MSNLVADLDYAALSAKFPYIYIYIIVSNPCPTGTVSATRHFCV